MVDYGGADASIRTLWVNLKATPETVTENDAFFSLVFRPKTNLFTMNGLVSFGGANDFKDLVVSSSDKLDIVNLQVNYKKANVKDFIIKRAYGNPFSGSDNLHLSI